MTATPSAAPPQDPPPRTASRLIRGYGPLIGFTVLFLLMSLFVPTRRQEVVTERVAAGTGGTQDAAGQSGSGAAGAGGDAAAGTAVGSGETASAGGSACPDRADQVQGDPYSPPCIAFSGSNGGATYKGVTDTDVVIAVRESPGGGFQDALATAAGAAISDSPEDTKRTLQGLADYFNANYQFYGRKIRLEFYSGQGDPLKEVLGGGQEGAEADAIKVSDQIGAFADLSAGTPPYADALGRRQIVNIGAPYMSREWFSQRAPYSWSPFTDCSIIVETVSDYYSKRLAHHPASLAKGDLAGRDRTPAVIAPENSWYQECVSAGLKIMEAQGLTPAVTEKYKLDLSLMSNQAVNLVAKLKNANVTTIVCGCDPVLLLFMTGKAREQNYFPEWIITGVAFTDQDIVGQLFDQDEWANSVGISFAGGMQPLKASLGYNAYKTVRSDEPAIATDGLYFQMLVLALGLQMAGPDLTPQTFQQGLFAYPAKTGPAGTWHFGPNDFTTSDDAREIYWDPNRRSVQNGDKGAYVDTEPGKRYPMGQFPAGEPKVG